jgi:hypothetical protein
MKFQPFELRSIWSSCILTLLTLGLLFSKTAYADCVPPPSGLVSWWTAEGNANDIAGANNGNPTGGIGYASGKVGQAFVFNGSTSYIPVPASASLNIGATGSGITIECWVKPNAKMVAGSEAPIVEWDSATTDGTQMWIGARLYANIKDTSGVGHAFQFITGFDTNNFQHVAVTYDKASGLMTFYINGSLVFSNNIGNITPQTSYPMNIGRRTGQPIGNGSTFNGLMDELSLYNRALSQTEIQAIYNAGSAGKCFASVSPPGITSQPVSRTNNVGTTASFSVVTDGPFPVNYQWKFNGMNILGATNTTLTIPNVQLSDAGSYSVLLVNSGGPTLSSNGILSVTVPDCTSAQNGLVSWWSAEGNANDKMGANNGIPTGGITYSNGLVGLGFVFNGSSSFIKAQASSSLNVGLGAGFTIETWVKPATYDNDPLLEWNNYAGGIGVHMWLSADVTPGTGFRDLYANLVDTGGNSHSFSSAAGIMNTNEFQHVALTYNKTTGLAVLYRNGVVVASQNLGSFTPQTSYDFYIGYRPDPVYFTGTIDESAVYNRALAADEIAAIYNAGSVGKCEPVFPPTIEVQPTNQVATVGDSVIFEVVAGGTSPLSYQWSFNGTGILGATNATLTLSTVQIGDAGTYVVTVTNLYGSAISSNALLHVNNLPVADAAATKLLVISVNNSNATVVLDGSLSYDLDGDPLQYAWYKTGDVSPLAAGVVAVVVLPVGTNSITLVVSDGLASSQQIIAVEVITIAQAVERLAALVNADVPGKQSLIASLNAALNSIDRSNPTAAINQLQAFQNKVIAQISPLDPELAQTLIDAAQSIINALSGGGAPANKTLKATAHGNGKVHLNFSGAHQQVYIIEASTNLVDWEMIGVATDQDAGSFDFDDPASTHMPGRFYRVVTP